MSDGKGLFVGWYDTDPAFQPELDRWHSHEHMPERVALPGFLTGQRYADIADPSRYAVIYRAAAVAVFASPAYLAILNRPTPWTERMMKGIRNLNRTLAAIAAEGGAGFGRYLLTLQLAGAGAGGEAGEGEARFDAWLREGAIAAALATPGVVRATLAVADAAISGTRTREKELRGVPDAVSARVFLAEGYDLAALRALATGGALSPAGLAREGARDTGAGAVARLFALDHLLVAGGG